MWSGDIYQVYNLEVMKWFEKLTGVQEKVQNDRLVDHPALILVCHKEWGGKISNRTSVEIMIKEFSKELEKSYVFIQYRKNDTFERYWKQIQFYFALSQNNSFRLKCTQAVIIPALASLVV